MLYVSSGKKISILQGQGAAIGAVGALSLEPPVKKKGDGALSTVKKTALCAIFFDDLMNTTIIYFYLVF